MEFNEWMKQTFDDPELPEGWGLSDLEAAWNASRENQQEYQSHEFCASIKCVWLEGRKCFRDPGSCCSSAKEFQHWLRDNGYRIVKEG